LQLFNWEMVKVVSSSYFSVLVFISGSNVYFSF